jgi:hypothetical protein
MKPTDESANWLAPEPLRRARSRQAGHDRRANTCASAGSLRRISSRATSTVGARPRPRPCIAAAARRTWPPGWRQ